MTSRSASVESAEDREHRFDLIASLKYEVVPLKSADAAIEALPPGSTVSVTCSPVKGVDATIELTDRLRSLGYTAVPHIAARMVTGPEHVEAIASWLRTEAVGHLFLVGGDAPEPHGPFSDALEFLRALLDADPELASIGVTAYPDGHPLIDPAVAREALHAKQALLTEAGVAAYATTQMCFDPTTIERWLSAERSAGLAMPVHLGLAGVVDRAKLMSMGVRLGVGTSLRYLKKNRLALGRLLTSRNYDPGQLLEVLSPALRPLGITGVHCFTFNQVAATAAWQHEVLTTR